MRSLCLFVTIIKWQISTTCHIIIPCHLTIYRYHVTIPHCHVTIPHCHVTIPHWHVTNPQCCSRYVNVDSSLNPVMYWLRNGHQVANSKRISLKTKIHSETNILQSTIDFNSPNEEDIGETFVTLLLSFLFFSLYFSFSYFIFLPGFNLVVYYPYYYCTKLQKNCKFGQGTFLWMPDLR